MSPPAPLATIPFTDGTRRHVFADARGQYVIGDDGERVYGTWFIPCEEADLPVIVEARR